MRFPSALPLIYVGILYTVMGVPCSHAASSLVRSGSFEVGPFLGASYGIDEARVMGGGNITYAINKYILPYFEFSYFPGIGRDLNLGTLQSGSPITAHTSIPLSDFHGGVHLRLPVFKEKPVVPYLVFGFGGLRHSDRTAVVSYQSFGATVTQNLDIPAGTDKAINFGAGIRYYMTQRFGIRVEAKAYKPYGGSTGFTDTFGKAEFGIFFQLH